MLDRGLHICHRELCDRCYVAMHVPSVVVGLAINRHAKNSSKIYQGSGHITLINFASLHQLL
ncbi:hypothetical protein BDQ17DRAFT_613574 [Cyathus striatus]|nr:hypothetical protein BDQ17DRAFT_613574 [Cyathus striatus]